MAHFYGELKGSTSLVSRLSGKNTGMRACIRGWDIGVKVYIGYNATTDSDEILVYKTSGSNFAKPDEFICKFNNKKEE